MKFHLRIFIIFLLADCLKSGTTATIDEDHSEHSAVNEEVFNEADSVTSSGKAIIRLGGGFGVTKTTGSTIKPLMIQLGAAYIMAMQDLNTSYSSRNIVFKMAMGDTHSTFTEAIKVAMSMGSTVFKTVGVHGFIGTNQSYTTEAADYVLQDTDTSHIAYGANDTALVRFYECIRRWLMKAMCWQIYATRTLAGSG
jgi:hypothetical protein